MGCRLFPRREAGPTRSLDDLRLLAATTPLESTEQQCVQLRGARLAWPRLQQRVVMRPLESYAPVGLAFTGAATSHSNV